MLTLESVHISYGAVEAIKDVSLEIQRGSTVAILGANGAGKSTLLKGLSGLVPLQSGRIVFEGHDISTLAPHQRLKRGIALSPEGRDVFPDQTVHENLLLGAYLLQKKQSKIEQLLQREFNRFPRLKERSAQLAGTLSGGEQQMLAISRALMSEPRLLLLDEPSLGLAPLIRQEIFKSIRELRAEGLTIVLVEQMAKQALAVADRAHVLQTGRVLMTGSGQEVAANPFVMSAYLGH